MPNHPQLRSFLSSCFEGDTPRSRAQRQLLKSWSPFIIIVIIATAPLTVNGILGRAFILAMVVTDLVRISGRYPWLNLWSARIVWLAEFCAAVAFTLAHYEPWLLLAMPAVVFTTALYVHFKYLQWKEDLGGRHQGSHEADGATSHPSASGAP